MASLVEELQRDALDDNVEVSALLRKAFVVSTKLKLDQFREWCDHELKGYSAPPLPEYRIIHGVLKAWNPFNGWIPVMSEDPHDIDRLSIHREGSAIGGIADLIRSDGQVFHVPVDARTQNYFRHGSGLDLAISLHIARGSVVRLLDAVRNTILTWSLTLEEEGIIGEGMSFSTVERSLAHTNAQALQSVVNNIFVENMINSSIQQSSPKGRQRFSSR